MQRMMSSQRGGLTYVPIVPCTILDTGGGPSGEMNGDEIRTFGISREQRLLQGGNEECGLPRGGEANIRAWAIDVRATASRGSGLVKVWQGEHPEPTEGVAGYDFGGSGAERFANFSVVPACGPLAEGGCWESDFNVRLKGSGSAGVVVRAGGYFIPVADAFDLDRKTVDGDPSEGTHDTEKNPKPTGPSGSTGPPGSTGSSGSTGSTGLYRLDGVYRCHRRFGSAGCPGSTGNPGPNRRHGHEGGRQCRLGENNGAQGQVPQSAPVNGGWLQQRSGPRNTGTDAGDYHPERSHRRQNLGVRLGEH